MHLMGSSEQGPLYTIQAGRVIDRLRAETGEQHDRLDHSLHIVERLSDAIKRPRLMGGYLTLHRTIEAAIAPFLRGIADLDFPARCRSALIADGMARLGHPASSSNSDCTPVVTRAVAFGALYVLEGSSLGGRFIQKELKRRGVMLEGLEFLDPYGRDVARRWQSFLTVLDREVMSCEHQAHAVQGARHTFAFAERCLSEENFGG